MFKLVKVSGDSMLPILSDGDYLLTKKPRSLRPGFIYVIAHIDLGLIVKRLEKVDGNFCTFKGDNPASLPHTLLGKVEVHRVTGRAFIAFTPSGVKRLKPI